MVYCSDEILAEEISERRSVLLRSDEPKPVFHASNKLRNKMTQDHVLKEYNRVALGTENVGLD